MELDYNAEAEKNTLQPAGKDTERSGLVYCKPRKAHVKVIDRTVLLSEAEVMVGQFGSLHQLPPSLLDSPDVSVTMDPATGALLNINTQ